MNTPTTHLTIDDTTALSRYARSGDPTAFNTLIHRYQGMVLNTCLRVLRSHADAEDATQETFLKLAKNAANIRGNAAAWLHTCALGTATDLLRSKLSRQRAEHTVTPTDPLTNPTAESKNWNELAPLLDAALDALNEQDRHAIVAHFLAGRPQRELAKEAGVSPGTMSRRIDSALDTLAASLKSSGLALAIASPAALAATLTSGAASVSAPTALTTSLAKVALGQTILSGKRTATGLLSTKATAIVAIATTAAVCSIGYVAFIHPAQPSAKPIASPAPSTTPTSTPEPIAYTSVPRPTKDSDNFLLFDDRLDGQPTDVFNLTFTPDAFTFFSAPNDKGVRPRVIASRPPTSNPEKGTLACKYTTFELPLPEGKPNPAGTAFTLDYSIRQSILTTRLTAEDKHQEAEFFVFRRPSPSPFPQPETPPPEAQPNTTSDPLLGDWVQVPLWWTLQLTEKDIVLNGGGGEYGKLNGTEPFAMTRFRILSWTQEETATKVEVICTDNLATKAAIGKRFKILLRATPTGYQLARPDFTNTSASTWPTFTPNKGDKVRVMTFLKELPK